MRVKFNFKEACKRITIHKTNEVQEPPILDNSVIEKQEVQQEDIDGGYGWVNVACVLLLTAHTWGINGVSVFAEPFLSFILMLTRTPKGFRSLPYLIQIVSQKPNLWVTPSSADSISQITFVGPIVTKAGRKFGLKPTLLMGAILEVCALISASFATRVWHLYLAQGALFGWGCGFQYIGASGVVPQWFTKQIAFANSIASAGSGIGGVYMVLGNWSHY